MWSMKGAKKMKATRNWPKTAWTTDMPFPPEVIEAGEMRGEMECTGPWSIVKSYKAIAMEFTGKDTSHYGEFNNVAIIHGMRSLLKPKQSGHALEGYVSINGKKRRAFTSSALFTVNGKLIDVSILYVR
jgi:hypothetical protein